MVTPNSRFMRAMVIGLWVMMTKRVSVERVISSSRSQKRSTLWSSSGASTSSSTQIGAGLVRNTAKISASAVSACSPPESSDSVAGFLPGGFAMISRPASSGSSVSISCSSAVPPPNSSVNSCLKWALTTSNEASSRSRASRLRFWMPWRSRLIASTRSSRSVRQLAVLGLDLAQLLLGAQVDGAEPLALAADAVELGLDLGDVGQLRARLDLGQLGDRGRLDLEHLADFVLDVGEPALGAVEALFGAGGVLARGADRFERGAGVLVGGGERVLGLGQAVGGGAARRSRRFRSR